MRVLNNGNHWSELPVNKLRISMNSQGLDLDKQLFFISFQVSHKCFEMFN